MEEIDIWQAAKILIDAHADQAEAQAEWRIGHALDQETAMVWKRIKAAITALQQQQPSASEPLN